MSLLSQEQRERALEAMRAYMTAERDENGDTPVERQAKRDQERERLIEEKLKPLLEGYLAGNVALQDFKVRNDSTNAKEGRWGFRGAKGQMFFNMLFNGADDLAELDGELKAAIAVPASEDMARSRIRTLASYVARVGEQVIAAGGSKRSRPRAGSIPFFLSYFWQIQDRAAWPVYYTNGVNTMTDMNLWQPSGDLGADYITFRRIHEELGKVLTEASGRKFGLYDVEHVFWFAGEDPYGGTPPPPKPPIEPPVIPPETITRLPESFVPPVVAILSRMASGGPDLVDAAKASGTSLERAFEKHIDAAFTILGYETKLMGQGGGRVPDGLALDVDSSYAILWDGKVRSGAYSMGTDDRTIREYIITQSRDLKRRRSLRNIYYIIVSSGFADDYDDAVRMLKMDTDVNEVCLVEAAALVEMVDARLRDPHGVSLGPDGLQRMFSTSGIVTAEVVKEMMG